MRIKIFIGKKDFSDDVIDFYKKKVISFKLDIVIRIVKGVNNFV